MLSYKIEAIEEWKQVYWTEVKSLSSYSHALAWCEAYFEGDKRRSVRLVEFHSKGKLLEDSEFSWRVVSCYWGTR